MIFLNPPPGVRRPSIEERERLDAEGEAAYHRAGVKALSLWDKHGWKRNKQHRGGVRYWLGRSKRALKKIMIARSGSVRADLRRPRDGNRSWINVNPPRRASMARYRRYRRNPGPSRAEMLAEMEAMHVGSGGGSASFGTAHGRIDPYFGTSARRALRATSRKSKSKRKARKGGKRSSRMSKSKSKRRSGTRRASARRRSTSRRSRATRFKKRGWKHHKVNVWSKGRGRRRAFRQGRGGILKGKRVNPPLIPTLSSVKDIAVQGGFAVGGWVGVNAVRWALSKVGVQAWIDKQSAPMRVVADTAVRILAVPLVAYAAGYVVKNAENKRAIVLGASANAILHGVKDAAGLAPAGTIPAWGQDLLLGDSGSNFGDYLSLPGGVNGMGDYVQGFNAAGIPYTTEQSNPLITLESAF